MLKVEQYKSLLQLRRNHRSHYSDEELQRSNPKPCPGEMDVTKDSNFEDTVAQISSTESVLKRGISEHIRDKLANTDTRTLLDGARHVSPSFNQSEKYEWMDHFDNCFRKFRKLKVNRLI